MSLGATFANAAFTLIRETNQIPFFVILITVCDAAAGDLSGKGIRGQYIFKP
jgi:hypothetical protein